MACCQWLAVASLLAILPPSTSRFCLLALYCYIPLPGWHPTATYWLAPYCSSSLAVTPSALWLRAPSLLSTSCELLGRKPPLGYDCSSYCTIFLGHSKRRCVARIRTFLTIEPPAPIGDSLYGYLEKVPGNSS